MLRHLDTHLPDDASITLATGQRDSSEVERLTKLMSAELCEKKRRARAVVEAQKKALSLPGGVHTTGLQQQERTAPEWDPASATVGDKGGLDPEAVKRESAEFAERQRLYRLSRTNRVGSEDVAKFEVAVQDFETETDVAVAKFRL